MSARRIMGTEVEYGISVPGDPTANPVITSTQVVLAYAAAAELPRAKRARWDYEVESPLRDARGFDLSTPSIPTSPDSDLDDLGAANVILTNGARLYVDHAHPEFSTPEVTTPRDIVIWDKAGERVMEEAAMRSATVPGAPRIQLYKNNVDGKGASYGSHENYLMSRSTTFPSIITGLIPFFASRQVVCGSGRVGIGPGGDEAGYQLTQRSDYIEVEVGLETTLKRGIINTRDEPHADADKYRRLHVIIGDANLAETSTFLKVGTTALVLDMIEAGQRFDDLRLAEPVRSVHAISRDPGLQAKVELADGRKMTGLDLQWAYHERAVAHVARTQGEQVDEVTAEVMTTWGDVLDALGRDPMECADRLDWPAKLRLLEGYRARDGLAWSSPRLQLVDLQYSDVRMGKGLYNRLVARGSMKRLVTEDEVIDAMRKPPEDTRAYFRGRCLERYPAAVAAASWDSVIFDLGRESLVRIPTLEPLRGTRNHVGKLIDASETAEELVAALTRG
ncbi:MAG: Pup amidohydrolase [Pseudonocardiales bacterium]|jgi:proteasome accessory factor PafA2|uniref:depupylase/deamidase Dop n=1 Tax=Pseudonocardia sp. Cha107L01 TaxID=3457576 RepID=UPI0028C9C3FF|nr:Pup amidohydrolase [Pseudonocardiales bacterium]MDT7629079.1 Pup amidohydrolase [Pseudonocardiales bacterium]MDT7637679.1 Pup amidohydrolase [Pseudonocardiales bacterium]MDT7691958.1 Pup amidohydrolase [Pseudonocardiales bacterium]